MNPYRKIRDFVFWWIVPGCLVLGAASFPLGDPDMWWHLAAGRMVLDGQFPATNTLSHTFPDHPWRFTQWLSGTLFAAAEKLGGFLAVQVVVFLFAAGTFLLVIATIRRDAPQARWHFVLPFFLIGMLAARFRFVPRGDLATLLGLAVVHHLWVVRPRRLPYHVFLIACIWSNLHAGVVFGVLEIGILGGAALLDRDRKSTRDALICGIAFFAGSLFNPFFFYPYLYILENIQVARHFPVPIAELKPPAWRDIGFLSLTALSVGGLIPALVHRRYRHAMLVVGSWAMAASAVRFTPFLAVLGLPCVVKSFLNLPEGIRPRVKPDGIRTAISALVLTAALFVGYKEWRKMPPGLGADQVRYPSGAADFILSRGFTGRMFNEFDQGGFLAWKLFPGRRVFIDGRGNAYPWEHFRQVAGYTRHTIAGVLDTYGVDHAVVQRRPFQGQIDWGPAFAAIGWKLVRIEGASFLFVRPGSPDGVRAGPDVFRFIIPWADPEQLLQSARVSPAEVHSELERIDPLSLLDVGDFNIFGLCAFLTGDRPLAIRFLSAGHRLYPAHLPLHLNYAAALDASGRMEEAATHYRRIIEADPASESAGKARQRLGSLRIPESR